MLNSPRKPTLKSRTFRKTNLLSDSLILVVVKAGCYYSLQTFHGARDGGVVDSSRGVDYKRFDESQAAYLPPTGRGRMLLAALGPDCLDSRELGGLRGISDEQGGKEFFENTWAPLCDLRT